MIIEIETCLFVSNWSFSGAESEVNCVCVYLNHLAVPGVPHEPRAPKNYTVIKYHGLAKDNAPSGILNIGHKEPFLLSSCFLDKLCFSVQSRD